MLDFLIFSSGDGENKTGFRGMVCVCVCVFFFLMEYDPFTYFFIGLLSSHCRRQRGQCTR